DRAPGRPIGLEIDVTRGHRVRHEVVEHDIEAKPRRYSVSRGRAQEDGTEAVAGKARDVSLRAHLRLTVGGDRVEWGGLVDQVLTGLAVVAARGGEHEALH